MLTPITLDFETYYDRDYSLRKMKTLAYVRDDRYLTHGVGLAIGDGAAHYVEGAGIAAALDAIDWSNSILVGHNLLFDGLVLFERYGHEPAVYADTLGMARALLPELRRKNLDTVASFLGHGSKTEGLADTMGLRELPPEVSAALGRYCVNDTELARHIFNTLYPVMPESERQVLSIVTRMGCVGKALFNHDLAISAQNRMEAEREALIQASGISESVLNSNQQFAEAIANLGLDVPQKISASTKKATWALAQSDLEYLSVVREHPELDHIWKARKAAKQTTTRTRIQSLVEMTDMAPHTLPFPYNYYGAHTGRLSGAGGINLQNLERKSDARKSIIAPPGKVIVVGDSGQIELRFNMWFCREARYLDVLRSGRDIYRYSASQTFGVPDDDVTFEQRQFGKMQELGLGYGMGTNKFKDQLAIGMLGNPPILLDWGEVDHMVKSYRHSHQGVTGMWRKLNHLLDTMVRGTGEELGCIRFEKDGILLPNGMMLIYPELSADDEGDYSHSEGKHIYGAKVLENIIQALARIVITDQLLEADAHPLLDPIGTTHDEIICLADENESQSACEALTEIMSHAPNWCMDLPLTSEVLSAPHYCK